MAEWAQDESRGVYLGLAPAVSLMESGRGGLQLGIAASIIFFLGLLIFFFLETSTLGLAVSDTSAQGS